MGYKTDFENVSKYVQGSIWHWNNKRELIPGVQGMDRPVLIISNDKFNESSGVVTCATITTTLYDSPVHVPIHITADCHIQCEQIQVIAKEELGSFKGLLPESVMAQVKEKLKIQFNIGADRNTDILLGITKQISNLDKKVTGVVNDVNASVALLLEQAERGFGLPNVETDFLKLVLDLNSAMEKIATEVDKIKAAPAPVEAPADELEPIVRVIKSRTGQKHRRYTDEEKAIITDPATTVEAIMEKFGFDKPAALKTKNYFIKRGGGQSDPNTDRHKGKRLTQAEMCFIADPANSIELIMEKFGYKRTSAQNARYRCRKILKEKSNPSS